MLLRRSLFVAVLLLAVTASPARADALRRGRYGAGDPYFPLAGNGGYDARHYALDLDYDRGAKRLDGKVQMNARATQDLPSFNLDLRDFLTVASVGVNGSGPTSSTRARSSRSALAQS